MKKKLIQPEDYPIYHAKPDENFVWGEGWTKEDIDEMERLSKNLRDDFEKEDERRNIK